MTLVHLEVKIQGTVIAAVESPVQEILGLCVSDAALTEEETGTARGVRKRLLESPPLPHLFL